MTATRRDVTAADIARGERLAALRATKWPSKGAAATAMGYDRVRVSRIESGQDRFIARDVHELYGKAFGVQPSAVVAYAQGEIELDDLLRGTRQAKPSTVLAAPHATPAPSLAYPNRDAVFALYAGKYDPEVFDYVAILANSGGDRSEEAWEAELVRAQGRRDRSGSPAIVATGEGIGDPGGFAALPPKAVKRRR
jgi:hypothetical protein